MSRPTTESVGAQLTRRRVAFIQADGLLRQAEMDFVALLASERQSIGSVVTYFADRIQKQITAADHILKQQVLDDHG